MNLCIALFIGCFAIVFSGGGVFSAEGEIVNCNGVLTNQACDGGTKVMAEKATLPTEVLSPEEKKRRSTIRIWLMDLDTARSKAQREHEVEVETSLTKVECERSSLQTCERLVAAKRAEINSLILSKLEIEEKRRKLEEEVVPTPSSQATTDIRIIHDHSANIYVRPNDRFRHRPYGGMGARPSEQSPPPTEQPVAPQKKLSSSFKGLTGDP